MNTESKPVRRRLGDDLVGLSESALFLRHHSKPRWTQALFIGALTKPWLLITAPAVSQIDYSGFHSLDELMQSPVGPVPLVGLHSGRPYTEVAK